MSKDIFLEQLIVKKKSFIDYFIQISVILVALILIPLTFIFSPVLGIFSMLSPIIVVAIGYGAYRIFISRNIEYEYIITNEEIDIDTIIHQSSRKRLFTFQISEIEKIGFYVKEDDEKTKYNKIFRYHENDDTKTNIIFLEYSSKEIEKALILISPNTSMLDGIEKALSGLARVNFMKERKKHGR